MKQAHLEKFARSLRGPPHGVVADLDLIAVSVWRSGDLAGRETTTHRAIDKPAFYDPLKSESSDFKQRREGEKERWRSNHAAQHILHFLSR